MSTKNYELYALMGYADSVTSSTSTSISSHFSSLSLFSLFPFSVRGCVYKFSMHLYLALYLRDI
jgi:hypothetical protein